MSSLVVAHIVVELIANFQITGVFRIKQEDNAGDKHVERPLFVLIVLDVKIALGKRIVKLTDYFAGRNTEIRFALSPTVFFLRKETQTVEQIGQFFQMNRFECSFRVFFIGIVDANLIKITSQDIFGRN